MDKQVGTSAIVDDIMIVSCIVGKHRDAAPGFEAARNVDFAISRFARPVGEEYSEKILFHDALVVVTGPNNPLTRRRKIELAELLSEPWVSDSPNTDFGAMQAGIFRAAGLDPPRLTVAATSIILRNELLATERFLTVVVTSRSSCRVNIPDLKHCP